MSWVLNHKGESQKRKDKAFIFSFILSFSIHILLIFYILISYKGEDKKKEIVWVSFHTAASGQKDMNVGIGGSTSESNEGSSAYQNNSSPLKSDSSPLKSNQNDEIKREEKKEDKVKKENNNKDQQDRKEDITKNKENITKKKENIKAEKSKYSNANIKKSSNEKKEIAKAEKDIRSQNKQSVRKDEKNNRKESISQTAYKSDSKNTKSDRNDVKDKDLKDKKKEKYGTGKYTAKDLDELEKALRELAKSYTGGGGSKGDSKEGEGSGRSSSGGNMQGGTGNGGAAQTFISLYAQLIRESIKKNFVIPPSLKGEFLSCVVYLKIGQDGSILDMDLEESSGNRNFDIFVMKAIRSSSPFPPPPSELEIYVRFSNRD